jgi:putative photosynthetic complex assembly protein 2
MGEFAFPVTVAIATWWLGTAGVLALNRLSGGAQRRSLVLATLAAGAALVAVVASRSSYAVTAAYVAFAASIVIWGWAELCFLSGVAAGPRRVGCPDACSGWQRFSAAVSSILYHELQLLALLALLAMVTWQAPNQVATATFAVLWIMRLSAKVNLFLGVRNFSAEFLPPQLVYLTTYFRRRPFNALLPWSIAGAVIAIVIVVRPVAAPDATPFVIASNLLVGTMLVLAIVEHVFLVLPVSLSRLWRVGAVNT